MNFTKVEAHVAMSKLQLTSSTGYVSHFMTIWKGLPLIVIFNHLNEEVFNLYYQDIIDEEEVSYIERIIKNYLNYE